MCSDLEPEIRLSRLISDNPGKYALLLGSGVSRSAGILTAWEMRKDVIEYIKKGKDSNEKDDQEFPSLSVLLSNFGTETERQSIIKKYIEPDFEKQVRIPKYAHRSIAKLVANGFINVILTTNFDKLLEMALNDIKPYKQPIIIKSPDDLNGIGPIQHLGVPIIIKVHGDYLDYRIKTTEEELNTLDSSIKKYLSKVFEEYGLIICGWSAEYDTALRNCLESTHNDYFTSFWIDIKEELSPSASKIINDKNFVKINSDLDIFLPKVETMVKNYYSKSSKSKLEIYNELSNEKDIILARIEDLFVNISPPGKGHEYVQYELLFRYKVVDNNKIILPKYFDINFNTSESNTESSIQNNFLVKQHNLKTIRFESGYGYGGVYYARKVEVVDSKKLRIYLPKGFVLSPNGEMSIVIPFEVGLVNTRKPGSYRLSLSSENIKNVYSESYVVQNTVLIIKNKPIKVTPATINTNSKWSMTIRNGEFKLSKYKDWLTIAFPQGTQMPTNINSRTTSICKFLHEVKTPVPAIISGN